MEQSEEPMLSEHIRGHMSDLGAVETASDLRAELERLRELEAIYHAEQMARGNPATTVLESNAFVAIQLAVEEAVGSGGVDDHGFAEVNCFDIGVQAGTSDQAIYKYLKRFTDWGLLEKKARRVPQEVDPLTGRKKLKRPYHMWVKPRPGTLVERLQEYASFDPRAPTDWGGARNR
jgi:hypothetical protein